MKDFVTEWGGLAGALVAVITLLTTVTRPIFRKKNGILQEISDLKLDTRAIMDSDVLQTAQLAKTSLDLLRLTMYAENIPLSERVNAGEEYVRAGGNGAAKVQHEANIRALREDRAGRRGENDN